MRPFLPLTLLLACKAPVEGDPVGVVRLTSTQWENSVAALLGRADAPGLSDAFLPDPAVGAFDTNAAQLSVTPTLSQQYQAASVQLAWETVSDPDRYAAVTQLQTPGFAGPDDHKAWLARIGRRAYRRTLTLEELAGHSRVFQMGRSVFPDRDPFVTGVQLSLVGFLQSPHFLYRVERAIEGEDELAPSSFASKLAYALWNGPPDDDLLEAAAGARSGSELLSWVPGMLADPRAREMSRDLHRQLLHVDNYANIPRVFVSHEDYTTTRNAAMQAEVDAFVEEVVFGHGTVADLLTSPMTFVDAQIAEIYGVEGIEGVGANALEPVLLDPDERSGLLTLSGFLAVHSSGRSENLIRRSAFIHEALLCTSLPPPPPSATALPPARRDETTRERIEAHTAGCGGACHQNLLNPIAYAFGQYDSLGAFRNADQIDTTATYTFSFGAASFDGAIELAELLADDATVHRCYAAHLLSYLEGRSLTAEDEDRLQDLAEASLRGESILDLIQDIVQDEGFRAIRR